MFQPILKMHLTLKRFEFGSTYTIGRLYKDEELICYVLEDKVREVDGQPVSQWKVQNETAIPKGTYRVVLDYSNRFKRELPHILNVPGYEGVRIHTGNSSKDTEGCLIVGMSWDKGDWVGSSKAAYTKLLPYLQQGKDITLTIS